MSSKLIALVWCVTQSVVFVSSLYVLVPSQVRALDRSHPLHIQYRMRALIVATVICGLGTYVLTGYKDPTEMMFLSNVTTQTTILPLVSYMVLFIGPLAQIALLPGSSSLNIGFGFWVDVRNLFVAPVTEELVFRTFTVATTAGMFSVDFIIYILPALFGFAHIHHAFMRVRRKECSPKRAFLEATFQTIYTTFFGALMMKVLFRTSNTLAVILIHSWCNLLGFPQVGALRDDYYNKERRLLTAMTYLIGILLFGNFDFIVMYLSGV